jgi:tetratricopeptide (TPR) repeat protein
LEDGRTRSDYKRLLSALAVPFSPNKPWPHLTRSLVAGSAGPYVETRDQEMKEEGEDALAEGEGKEWKVQGNRGGGFGPVLRTPEKRKEKKNDGTTTDPKLAGRYRKKGWREEKTDKEEPVVLISRAEARKADGNARLKAGEFAQAREEYVLGTKDVEGLLEKTPGSDITAEELQAASAVYIALNSNAAQAALKEELWEEAIDHSSKVLIIDRQNSKALFRRGLGRSQYLGRLEEAKEDFTELLRTDPSNKEARAQVAKVKQAIKDKKESEKATYQGMFSGN